MNDTEKLFAIEEIKKLKARYFRSIDTKDVELFSTLFAEDCVCDFRGSATDPQSGVNYVPSATEAVNHGRANMVEAARGAFQIFNSVHHGHMPEIEITSPTTAKAVWAMMDLLQFPATGSALDGYGHYFETYEKIGGEWKFKTIKLTRIRLDFRQP